MFNVTENICTCEAPLFGTLCELECKNGGTIQLEPLACQCAEGFKGTECDNGTYKHVKFWTCAATKTP